MGKGLAGLKIRTARVQLGLTQREVAHRAGISASYLNLIEQNRRPVGGVLLERIAASIGTEPAQLDGEAERRIVDELKEVSVDPAIAGISSERCTAEEFVGRHRGWVDLLLGLYRAYRQRNQDVLVLADRLNRDPFLGESVHQILTKVASIRSAAEIVEMDDELDSADRARFLAIIAADGAELSRTARSLVAFFESADTRIRAATPTEHVDSLVLTHQNYFPELEAFAEEVRRRHRPDDLVRARSHSAHPPDVEGSGGLDVSGESRRFRALRAYVAGAAADEVDAILARHSDLLEAGAHPLAAAALEAYAAAAILMPYAPFIEAAERHRYDLDILTRLFGVTYEQAAHRVATLRRPGSEGPRFAFMRSDASGFITKRLPLPQLPLPRYGHACPLWVVYGAFQAPGVTARAFGELPSGEQFLFFARAVEKRPARAGYPRHLLSVMLACSALDAPRVSAGDGIDRSSAMVPLGTTCRLCPRTCEYRQEPQLST